MNQSPGCGFRSEFNVLRHNDPSYLSPQGDIFSLTAPGPPGETDGGRESLSLSIAVTTNNRSVRLILSMVTRNWLSTK